MLLVLVETSQRVGFNKYELEIFFDLVCEKSWILNFFYSLEIQLITKISFGRKN
jgi:hypothetical protein